MDRKEFLNKIDASFEPSYRDHLNRYFCDYTGPYDDDTAMEYIRYLTKYPGDISRYTSRGLSHRQSVIKNGTAKINHSLGHS